MDYDNIQPDSPLHDAVWRLASNEELAQLIKQYPIDSLGHDNNTPLLIAMILGINAYAQRIGLINNRVIKETFFAERTRVIEFLLDNGACVNIMNIYGKRALYYAIKHNGISESLALRILKKTNDFNSGIFCNEYLMMAIIGQKENVAVKLLEHGASGETNKTSQGYMHSILICSIIKKLDRVTNLLLAMDINIFVPSYNGDQLYHVIKNHHTSLARRMIDYNFGINYIYTKHAPNKIDIAKKYRSRTQKKYLFKTFPTLESEATIIPNTFQYTLINTCIKFREETLACLLLNKINTCDITITIRIAIKQNMNIFVAKFLTLYFDQVNNTDYLGNTILHDAFYNNNTRAISMLLHKGFKTDIKNNKGVSVNDIIALDIVNIDNLVCFGKAYFESLKNSEYFPYNPNLHNKSNLNNNILTVESNKVIHNPELKLLDDVIINYNYTKDQLDYLVNTKYLINNNAIGFLVKKYPYFTTRISSTDKLDSIIKHIINANPNPRHYDYPNIFGCTALHYAIKFEIVNIALYLIDIGYNINLQNKKGDTPLILAIRTCNMVIINKLLSYSNININEQTKTGHTALLLAMNNRLDDVVSKLINMGASILLQLNNKKQFDIMISKQYQEIAIRYYVTGGFLEYNILKKVVTYKMFKLATMMVDDKIPCDANVLAIIVIKLLNHSEEDLAHKILTTYSNVAINTNDKLGNTMLHASASCGSIKVANLLLSKGIRTNKKNYQHKTAFDIAKELGYNEICNRELKLVIDFDEDGNEDDEEDEEDEQDEQDEEDNEVRVIKLNAKKRKYDAFIDNTDFISF
jgi:ankyrin repeat protein